MSVPPVFTTRLSNYDYQQLRLVAGPNITEDQPQRKKFPIVPVAATTAVVTLAAGFSPQIKKHLPKGIKKFLKNQEFLQGPIQWADKNIIMRAGDFQDTIVRNLSKLKNAIFKEG